jgi:hypothetical protein
VSRSQSHERKLRREWLKQGAYAWQQPLVWRGTQRGTWRGGPVAFPPENLPREQAALYLEQFRQLHPEIVQFWAERYRK